MRTERWLWTARILTLIWAAFWTWFGLASGIGESHSVSGVLLHVAAPGLVFLAFCLLAWRWRHVGGILLVATATVVAIVYPAIMGRHFPTSTVLFVLATMALPPLVAGLMFLKAGQRQH